MKSCVRKSRYRIAVVGIYIAAHLIFAKAIHAVHEPTYEATTQNSRACLTLLSDLLDSVKKVIPLDIDAPVSLYFSAQAARFAPTGDPSIVTFRTDRRQISGTLSWSQQELMLASLRTGSMPERDTNDSEWIQIYIKEIFHRMNITSRLGHLTQAELNKMIGDLALIYSVSQNLSERQLASRRDLLLELLRADYAPDGLNPYLAQFSLLQRQIDPNYVILPVTPNLPRWKFHSFFLMRALPIFRMTLTSLPLEIRGITRLPWEVIMDDWHRADSFYRSDLVTMGVNLTAPEFLHRVQERWELAMRFHTYSQDLPPEERITQKLLLYFHLNLPLSRDVTENFHNQMVAFDALAISQAFSNEGRESLLIAHALESMGQERGGTSLVSFTPRIYVNEASLKEAFQKLRDWFDRESKD